MRRIRKKLEPARVESVGGLKISMEVGLNNIKVEPLILKWKMKMPLTAGIHKWRYLQLSRYLDIYPNHKPQKIKAWLDRHHPHP